jgi:hypothetical protein
MDLLILKLDPQALNHLMEIRTRCGTLRTRSDLLNQVRVIPQVLPVKTKGYWVGMKIKTTMTMMMIDYRASQEYQSCLEQNGNQLLVRLPGYKIK